MNAETDKLRHSGNYEFNMDDHKEILSSRLCRAQGAVKGKKFLDEGNAGK